MHWEESDIIQIAEMVKEGKEYLFNNDLDHFFMQLEDKYNNTSDTGGVVPIRFMYQYMLDNGINPMDYMTYIPRGAYYRTSISEITIPDNITSIEDHAFSRCSALKEVHLPDSVTHIGSHAFGQSGLERINIPETIDYLSYTAFNPPNSINYPVPILVVKKNGRAKRFLKDKSYTGYEIEEI